MFKRSTKITSLLVAAASVASTMTPVMAADVKRIESEDGKIYKAFAYKDGQAYIDGDVNDGEAVYLFSNGKYEKLSDLDSDSQAELYGEKYVSVDDGDYYVDLETGKVSDDDMIDDDKDDAASALRKKIKDDTDERYDENFTDKITNMSDALTGNKYGENWYQKDITAATGAKGASKANGTAFDVYTDGKGNYIDADYNLGRIKVTSIIGTTTGSSVYVDNTKDKFDLGKDLRKNLHAELENSNYLTQDEKYIYRMVTVKLVVDTTEAAEIEEVNGITVRDHSAFTVNSDKSVEFKAIQKISKAQASDEVDGAKYAKDVTTYIISKDDGKGYINSDGSEEEKYEILTNKWKDTKYTVANGTLVAYRFTDSKQEKIQTVSIKLSKKKNLNYTDIKGKAEEDVEAADKVGAVTTDKDGNLWRINGGYVYKWDNDEDWDKVYKVDGSMDALSVYDKDNMVVWSEDDEVYSIIGSTSKEEEKPVEETPAVVAGWNQAADGTWTYVNADGTTVKGWFQSPASGKWFYMDPATGVMQTGWVQSPASGKWFYMNPSNGDMMTGWVQVGTTWYYLNPSNGDMQTGWINDGNAWYYCDASGAMLSNTTVDGYVLGANGAWIR